MKVLRKLTKNIELRVWQNEFLQKYFDMLKQDFLLVSAPATGKTLAALLVAYNLLLMGLIKRIVVIVPTNHLKIQWAEAASFLGIDLDPFWSNSSGREASDYHGVVVTYSQVCNSPDLYDFNCLDAATFVIFDEIHHSAEFLAWGIKLLTAFANAVFRLALSGTPFRNDDFQIPFVTYEDRRCLADYVYSYAQAVADGVCSSIFFPTIAGQAAWIRGNGDEISCSMLDNLSKQKTAERLSAVLDPTGDWLPAVLRKADETLTIMRLNGHADAAGLVICRDQFHAVKTGELLKVITNEEPTVVISDVENSSQLIRDFARAGNRKRWIVAVKMISEGVDITRLKVGVYANPIRSELFFRQVTGRFTRIIPGRDTSEDQSAALFLPSDPTLIEYALRIKSEREHFLQDKVGSGVAQPLAAPDESEDNKNSPEINPENGQFAANGVMVSENAETSFGVNETPKHQNRVLQCGGKPRNFIIPLSSQAQAHDTIFNGISFPPAELQKAEALGKQIGVKLSPAQLAAIMRLAGEPSAEPDISLRQPIGSQDFDTQTTSAVNQAEPSVHFNQNFEPTNANTENNSHEKPPTGNFSVPVQPAEPKISEHYAVGIADEDLNLSSYTLAERKKKLKQTITRLANQLARLTCADYDEIHRRWIRERQGMRSAVATEANLLEKIDWIKNQISEFYRCRSEIN